MKIGDKVYLPLFDVHGQIIAIESDWLGFCSDAFTQGFHDLGGRCLCGHGLWVREVDLEIIHVKWDSEWAEADQLGD